MKNPRYVFFGTPNFAAVILEKLIAAGMPPAALVCNPDKPVGRKQIITPPAAKALVRARKLPIEIFQPKNTDELLDIGDILFKEADLGILAAYGQIIPLQLIQEAKLGIIGVHPSLLPKYRGPTPIQTAILKGDSETGVTLFLMDAKVDHGSMVSSIKYQVSWEENYEILGRMLAELAGDLLIETLPRFVKGEINSVPQEESEATYTSKFSAEDGYIDPDDLKVAMEGNIQKAELIHRKVRALNPEPGVYTILDDKRTKILLTEIRDEKLVLKRIQRAGGRPKDFESL